MINWKFYLIIFIFIELIYRLILIYNHRLAIEPLCITLINCPKEHIRLKYHLGFNRINFLTKFSNWYKSIYQCQIIEYDFYLSHIIRSIDIILFIVFLIHIIC